MKRFRFSLGLLLAVMVIVSLSLALVSARGENDALRQEIAKLKLEATVRQLRQAGRLPSTKKLLLRSQLPFAPAIEPDALQPSLHDF